MDLDRHDLYNFRCVFLSLFLTFLKLTTHALKFIDFLINNENVSEQNIIFVEGVNVPTDYTLGAETHLPERPTDCS
jgi:hypothetical protein